MTLSATGTLEMERPELSYLVYTMSEPIRRRAYPIVDRLVCDTIRVFAVLAERAVDLFCGRVERVRITALHRVDGLVGEAICADDDGSKTSLHRL